MDIGGEMMRVGKEDLKKPNQARVYLNEENQQMLDKLAENQPDLEKSKIMSILLSAALRAAKQNNYRLPMPLHFTISEGALEYSRAVLLSESPPKKR